jgi:hypothetical protein
VRALCFRSHHCCPFLQEIHEDLHRWRRPGGPFCIHFALQCLAERKC